MKNEARKELWRQTVEGKAFDLRMEMQDLHAAFKHLVLDLHLCVDKYVKVEDQIRIVLMNLRGLSECIRDCPGPALEENDGEEKTGMDYV